MIADLLSKRKAQYTKESDIANLKELEKTFVFQQAAVINENANKSMGVVSALNTLIAPPEKDQTIKIHNPSRFAEIDYSLQRLTFLLTKMTRCNINVLGQVIEAREDDFKFKLTELAQKIEQVQKSETVFDVEDSASSQSYKSPLSEGFAKLADIFKLDPAESLQNFFQTLDKSSLIEGYNQQQLNEPPAFENKELNENVKKIVNFKY